MKDHYFLQAVICIILISYRKQYCCLKNAHFGGLCCMAMLNILLQVTEFKKMSLWDIETSELIKYYNKRLSYNLITSCRMSLSTVLQIVKNKYIHKENNKLPIIFNTQRCLSWYISTIIDTHTWTHAHVQGNAPCDLTKPCILFVNQNHIFFTWFHQERISFHKIVTDRNRLVSWCRVGELLQQPARADIPPAGRPDPQPAYLMLRC